MLFDDLPDPNAFLVATRNSGDLLPTPPVWVARRYVDADECEVEVYGPEVPWKIRYFL